jgi:hypothetical protein
MTSTAPQTNANNNNNNDTDLDDLLQEESPQKENHLEMTPLNLDYLTRGHHHQLEVMVSSRNKNGVAKKSSSSDDSSTLLLLLQASCTYIAYAHPRLCATAAIFAILLLFFGLWNVLMNPTIQYGNVEHDFSLISSKFDLKQSAIDHWCLRGDDDSCRCEDPLVPASRGEFPTWTKAHRANKEMLSAIATAEKSQAAAPVQVAFVGESLVEEMGGRWMGQSRGPQLVKMANMFASKFSSTEHGVKGVALGIAGDTVRAVLFYIPSHFV